MTSKLLHVISSAESDGDFDPFDFVDPSPNKWTIYTCVVRRHEGEADDVISDKVILRKYSKLILR